MTKDNVFGKRLQMVLQENNISARQLANGTDITEVSISRYINGTRTPKIGELSRIAVFLGCSADYLIGLDKRKEEQTLGILLNEIPACLSNTSYTKNIFQYYWDIGVCAEKLLNLCYEGEPVCFPVDITKIADKLGIFIEDADMRDLSNENIVRPNRKVAQISVQTNIFTEEKEAVIYTEKYVPASSKRYAITHEIVQYILHKNNPKLYDSYFVMPMCPTRSVDLLSDLFSIFLLIPIRNFLKEYSEYVEKRTADQDLPISTEEWIKYLSERAGIPEYHVACGYQYLRSVAYWLYEVWELKEDKRQLSGIGMTEENQKKLRNWMPENEFENIKKCIYQLE